MYNNNNNGWLLYSANLPVKETQCASTHHSHKYTQRHKHNLPLHTHTHTHTHHALPRFMEMPVEKGKFWVGLWSQWGWGDSTSWQATNSRQWADHNAPACELTGMHNKWIDQNMWTNQNVPACELTGMHNKWTDQNAPACACRGSSASWGPCRRWCRCWAVWPVWCCVSGCALWSHGLTLTARYILDTASETCRHHPLQA